MLSRYFRLRNPNCLEGEGGSREYPPPTELKARHCEVRSNLYISRATLYSIKIASYSNDARRKIFHRRMNLATATP